MRQLKESIFILSIFSSVLSAQAQKNDAPLSSNAPQDKVMPVYNGQLKQMDSILAPYISQAKSSYGQAKERFLKGLPSGEAFFVVTRIFDTDGKFEQVFMRVKNYKADNVSGIIANDLSTVKEYKVNQLIVFKEIQVLDWLITKPDGSEEGNFIGKYLDTKQ